MKMDEDADLVDDSVQSMEMQSTEGSLAQKPLMVQRLDSPTGNVLQAMVRNQSEVANVLPHNVDHFFQNQTSQRVQTQFQEHMLGRSGTPMSSGSMQSDNPDLPVQMRNTNGRVGVSSSQGLIQNDRHDVQNQLDNTGSTEVVSISRGSAQQDRPYTPNQLKDTGGYGGLPSLNGKLASASQSQGLAYRLGEYRVSGTDGIDQYQNQQREAPSYMVSKANGDQDMVTPARMVMDHSRGAVSCSHREGGIEPVYCSPPTIMRTVNSKHSSPRTYTPQLRGNPCREPIWLMQVDGTGDTPENRIHPGPSSQALTEQMGVDFRGTFPENHDHTVSKSVPLEKPEGVTESLSPRREVLTKEVRGRTLSTAPFDTSFTIMEVVAGVKQLTQVRNQLTPEEVHMSTLISKHILHQIYFSQSESGVPQPMDINDIVNQCFARGFLYLDHQGKVWWGSPCKILMEQVMSGLINNQISIANIQLQIAIATGINDYQLVHPELV
ncbi:MAG: hypothetical protein GY702_28755, partial [Desulfobulbaceae bacterium]|nr:hypothetical protein [Desulfobulbaceae bacterium]